MTIKRTFTATVRRHLLACFLALVTAIVMIPGMTTYIPFAISEKIILPLMLFPFIWVALFIYAYMAKNIWHPFLLMLFLIIVHVLLSYLALTGSST